MSLVGELLGAAGTAYITEDGIDKARQLPDQLAQAATGVSDRVGEAARFQPYAISTGSGSANFTPEGMTQQLSGRDQATVGAIKGAAARQAGMLGDVTPEQLMSQMQAMRQPEQERAQLGLENRLAAQGRLGVQTAAYGGTPEQLAMQKAIQEQQSADAYNAISQARQLTGMDVANLTGMLTAAGLPQQQLTQSLQPALQGMALSQQGNQTYAQAIANLGQQQLAGIPSAINAEALLRQAQLEGVTNLLMPQMNAQGNMVDTAVGGFLGDAGSAVGDFLGGGIEQLVKWAGGLLSGGPSDDGVTNGSDYNIDSSGRSGEDVLQDILKSYGSGGGGGVNTPATITGPGNP